MLPNFRRRLSISTRAKLTATTLSLILLSQFILLPSASANNTAQVPNPPFSQNWTNTGLITANDNWSGVPGIEGFLGQDITTSTGVNPQTLLGTSTVANDLDVIANQTNPNTLTNGGVAEFDGIANPTIALQGSGTADAPHIIIYLNTSGLDTINVAYDLRDIDGSADDATQQVALQYRVGSTGNFTNVPAGYVADATTGPSLATLVTPVNVTLPAAVNNQPLVQVRVMTTNAAGTDEWVGIDNIVVSGNPISSSTNPSGVGNANPSSVAAGDPTLLTVTVTPGTNPTSTAHTVSANLSSIGGSSSQTFFDDGTNGDVTMNDNVFSYSAVVANGTSGGAKSLPVTITETSPLSRTGSTSISLTVLAPSNPSGTGSASPNSVLPGADSLLTVNVTPGTSPPSTGLAVTADLSSIGGSSTQAFSGSGNTFTFTATVAMGTTPGLKTLPVQITDAQARSGSTSISLTVESPPPPIDHVVISQIYGGGGNSGATYTNDYVELYNPTSAPFNLTGWTLQYGSATGTSWTNNQPLGGTIGPGEYYLVGFASGGAVGAPLPVTPNISGDINMSATAGKIALVNNSTPLVGSCPTSDPDLVDFVGYGTTANCHEGSANAPAPANDKADFRKGNGLQDTNQNGADFVAQTPLPRRTAPITELGPWVASTDPISNGSNVPRDASMTVNFSEPVTLDAGWYNINCANTGVHNDATVAGSGKTYVITPNTNFQPAEQCTVTINKNAVHDQDTDDSGADTDTLFADYSWSFTVSTGTAPPYPPTVHLTMGNPSNATADVFQPNNYLMEKPEFALSYNRDRGTPNWVSWHLDNSWTGTLTRVDTFRPDPAVPPDWYRVQATDYFSSGFDRGHMTPNADRDKETSPPINQATFLMSNMVPQAPDNNQGPWANLENYLRNSLTDSGANELYIVSGPAGTGGSGSNGGTTTTIANGHVTVPAQTWKVVLVLPKATGDDVSRVTCGTRTIAVIMPNTQGIRNNDWHQYLVSVDQVEALTGYDFFSNLPDAVENCVEAGVDGSNPPGTSGQSVTTNENTAVAITLSAASPNNNPLTYTIVSGPTHGNLTGSGANRTYTPNNNYVGPDSFTFKVNDGTNDSNISTVSITVNAVSQPAEITWSNPADIIYGTALSGTQLNATANTPGTFTYTPAAGTVLGKGTHTLHVDFTPTDTVNYTSSSKDVSINVLSAVLNLSMIADRNPAPVELNFNYKATITNTGNASATNTVLTDVLPSGVTYTSASATQGTCSYNSVSRTVTCNLGTIGTGSNAMVTITVKPREEGTLNNTATITASQWDPATGNNSASVNGLPAVKFVDLAVTMTESADPIFSGENETYTILVKNINTPHNATGVSLTDSLPASMTFVSATTSQGSLITPPVGSTGIVTANLGTIAPNAMATVTITAKSSTSGAVTNSASASSTESESNPSNNTDSQTTTVKTAVLQKVLLAKQVLTGGCENTTGNVYLTGPAPAGGMSVPLSTSGLAGVSVPASVFIPAGQTVSPAFNVTTSPVGTKQVGLVIAGSGQGSVSRNLTINVGSGTCPP